MLSLNNVKIGKRLIIIFVVIILLTMGATGYALIKMRTVNKQIDEIYKVNLLSIDYLIEADRDAYQSNLSIAQSLNEITYTNSVRMKEAQASVWENYEQIATRYKNFEESFRIDDKTEFAEKNAEFYAYYASLKTETEAILLNLSADRLDEAVKIYYSSYNVVFENMRVIMNDFTEMSLSNAEKYYLDSKTLSTKIYTNTVIINILAVILIILFAVLLTRSIVNPLSHTVEIIKRIADGDLTVNPVVRGKDEIADLLSAVSNMSDKLKSIIKGIVESSHSLSSSSSQFSNSSQQMSQGASEQASSAEEVSSSMEEMAANIQQNTENARQTEKIALNAAEGINKVAEAASQTLVNMEEIADKVSIIGEIARQTNILALNAAVEAARAGEHGKGFAVVAAEVRKLAERSQVAAVEIDTLTKTSVKTTDEAGRMMNALTPEISKTARLVQEIAAASIEQNSGAEQVNNAIQQLNQVTQQNAAASEEMATSSQELASHAQQLMEIISFFKTGSEEISGKQYRLQKQNIHQENINPRTEKPVSKLSETNTQQKKGVKINMGKDGLDEQYEKF